MKTCFPTRTDSTRRTALIALILAATLAGTACTTVVRTPAPPPRVVYREMPAPVVEVVPAAPGPGFNWVPGHWAWRDGAWRWAGGRYVQAAVVAMPAPLVEEIIVAPSPAHVWVRGHWRWGGAGWTWVRGTWVL